MTLLPVLLYHSIDDDPPGWIASFAVCRRTFANQLDMIVDSGRVPVTPAQVIAARRGGEPLPANAVAVTFDDGFGDFATTALPELARHGIPSALYVTTGALAPKNRSLLHNARMLTVRQLPGLAAAGVQIGAHTHRHPQLDTLDTAGVVAELTLPKRILEDTLGREVDQLAYPHGYSNPQVRKLTGQAGYRGAFAVRNAFSPETDDPFRIARLTVKASTTRARFESWLRGASAPSAPAHDRWQTVCWRIWRRERARLHV
jgi:peptidoglycan/xylan/chitin deacetylase (PgdA/CDA1 family)